MRACSRDDGDDATAHAGELASEFATWRATVRPIKNHRIHDRGSFHLRCAVIKLAREALYMSQFVIPPREGLPRQA
jgi:hypothetical protein